MSVKEVLPPYPTKVEDVTAEVLARNLSAAMVRDHAVARLYAKHRDVPSMVVHARIHLTTTSTCGLVYLLRHLIDVDRARADELARLIWNMWEDDDATSHLAWQWTEEYGMSATDIWDATTSAGIKGKDSPRGATWSTNEGHRKANPDG